MSRACLSNLVHHNGDRCSWWSDRRLDRQCKTKSRWSVKLVGGMRWRLYRSWIDALRTWQDRRGFYTPNSWLLLQFLKGHSQSIEVELGADTLIIALAVISSNRSRWRRWVQHHLVYNLSYLVRYACDALDLSRARITSVLVWWWMLANSTMRCRTVTYNRERSETS